MNAKAFIFLCLFFSAAALLFCSIAVAETAQLDQNESNAAEQANKVEDAKYKCKHRCCSRFKGCWCCSASEARVKTVDENGPANNAVEETNEVEDAKYYKCKHRCCHPRIGCRCCSASEAQFIGGGNTGGEAAGKGGHGNEGQPREVEN